MLDWRKAKFISKCCIFSAVLSILAVLCGIDAYAEDSRVNNILIINSYQKGLSWTDGETDGIVKALRGFGGRLAISVEYMDWKSYPTRENLEHLRSYLKYKYSSKNIDLLITTDDAALEFALNNRRELFSDASLVFCGVNNEGVEKLINGAKGVTGISEEVDPEGTVKAALKINPNLKEVYVVYDNSESGISTGKMAVNAVHKAAPGVKAIALNEGTGDGILQKVGQASKDSIILITTYYSDSQGNVMGFEDFCERISRTSHVPVFHIYDFGLGHGALGGSLVSGKVQGEYAGKIALRLLNGEAISRIPIYTLKTNQYIFDYEQLQRFNIDLKKIPQGSEIFNKPFSFLETYKNLVITVLIIFVILVVFIFILLFYIKKISRMRRELAESNSELTQIYEELAASEEELRQQFDELTNAQREVRKLNDELELRVAERTNELQAAVSQLEAFTYTVSHDLKSPLRAVEGYSRIIAEDYGTSLDSDVNQMLQNIRNVCKDMIAMINKLLEFAMTSRSVLNLEKINTREMFVMCFNEAKAAYVGRDISLKIETPLPDVTADRILLRQAIGNILSNAMKFTKNEEYTDIRVGSTQAGSEYIFYVRDNGIGFDMNYYGKLFGIFQRLHSGKEFEGSGIGLVTIKKIIEKHGGRTWMEGEVGVGATMYFSLPFNSRGM